MHPLLTIICKLTFERTSLTHLSQVTKERRATTQECRIIADWLTQADYGPQHRDIFARHQEGTGQWLLNTTEFQTWLTSNNLTLVCSGMPGAGKTVTSSTVIEHLWTKFRDDPSTGIAFLYCNYKSQQNQKPVDLLAALLKQLVQEQSSPPPALHTLYTYCKNKRIPPSLQEISDVFNTVVAGYSRTFIVIDALDECKLPDGGREKFLSVIFDLQAKTGANLFATSRHIPDILERFQGSVLEIRASDEDIRRYVEGYIPQFCRFVSQNPTLQEEIKSKIVKAVDGMYVVT